jgi:putative acetyltransferase
VPPQEGPMSEEKAEIRVRAMNAADWRDLHEIWTDPRVCWGTLQTPFQSEDEVRKKVENPPERMVRLVAEVDGRVVGASGLQRGRSPRMQHVASCGVSVHPDCWKRVELEVYVDNAPAIHLYEKFGFVIEGTKRKYAFREGEYVDTYVMARVRD